MAEFFHMGGYAAFVWSSYALTFVVLLLSLWLPWSQKKNIIRSIRGRYKREMAEKQNKDIGGE